MDYHRATQADVPALARINHQPIRDEGHPNPMTIAQLKQRMRGWPDDEYTAILFETGGVVQAYALYRFENDHIYLRQFFVAGEHRRQNIGRKAIGILCSEILPANQPVQLEVLVGNRVGHQFWKSAGFSEVSITMELRNKN